MKGDFMDPNDEARVLRLEQIFAAQEQRINFLEQQLATLGGNFNRLLSEFFPPFVNRIKALEEAGPAVSSKGPGGARADKKRQPMTYATYLQVKALDAGGKTRKQIVTQLGIPYTTVTEYLKWTESQVADAAQKEAMAQSDAINSAKLPQSARPVTLPEPPQTVGFETPPDEDWGDTC